MIITIFEILNKLLCKTFKLFLGKLVHIQGIEAGVHMMQPWFHSGMTREQATSLVAKHGTVDG